MTVWAPSTSPAAINPSDLAARGAAIQASLVEEFEKDDIDQSTHPMVTATPHLGKAIGVQLVSAGGDASTIPIFKPLLHVDTALPARRSARYTAPKEGGDVLIHICEGARAIKVTKPEPKPKAAEGEEDEDIDSDEEEEEDIRDIVWNVSSPIAEFAIKDVKPVGKVEVVVSVNEHLAMQITARDVEGKSAVRGDVSGTKVMENGAA